MRLAIYSDKQPEEPIQLRLKEEDGCLIALQAMVSPKASRSACETWATLLYVKSDGTIMLSEGDIPEKKSMGFILDDEGRVSTKDLYELRKEARKKSGYIR